MKRIIRLTESDLKRLVDRSVNRILSKGGASSDIILAQRDLMKMNKVLSSIGLRLQGTHYQPLYERMRDSIIALNNNLINDIRGNSKQ